MPSGHSPIERMFSRNRGWQTLPVVFLALIAGIPLAAAEKSSVASTCGEQAADQSPNFVRDVLPVLTKSGCNSGGCHGSFQGRGGFRLSLWGFDPEFDYRSLTQDSRGRRIFASS